MHSEVLQLHNGQFEHRIETDIGPESEAAGTYSIEQDRLKLDGGIEPSGRPNGLIRLRPPFVIDVHGDKPVLWRSPAMKERAEVVDGSVGQYDLLIYVGPETGADLSCSGGRSQHE